MATNKPIYEDKHKLPNEDLYKQLCEALTWLHEKMQPSIPITRGRIAKVGFGVNKSQRSIAADAVISIAREIKSKPGW